MAIRWGPGPCDQVHASQKALGSNREKPSTPASARVPRQEADWGPWGTVCQPCAHDKLMHLVHKSGRPVAHTEQATRRFSLAITSP